MSITSHHRRTVSTAYANIRNYKSDNLNNTKDTCWTALCVAVSGDCDSFKSFSICLKPSSCGCHAIFIIACPLTPEERKYNSHKKVITCPITKVPLNRSKILRLNLVYNI